MPKAKKLLSHINKTFGTLAFCRRWLERDDGGSSTINGNTVNKEINYTFLIYLVDIFFCLFINYIKLINYSFDCLCLYFCIKFTLFFIYLFNYLFIFSCSPPLLERRGKDRQKSRPNFGFMFYILYFIRC